MDKKYEDSIHRTGRIGIIIGIILMLGIPAVISSVYDVWPESAAQVITAGSGLLAVFIPTCIAEVFSYTPILGSSAYITFLTGNVMNLKVPVVVNAQIMSDTASGTEEGDAVATIGVAVSSIVTTLIIAGGVLLLVPLRPILTSPTVQTATTYLLPALFGGIFLSFVNNDCGDYVAKGKPLTMILPLLVVFGVNAVFPLAGMEGFVVLICMVLTVLCAVVLYKAGIIKMTPKEKKKKPNAKGAVVKPNPRFYNSPSFLFLFLGLTQAPGIFLHQPPGHHDHMAAAQAFQPEVCAHPQDLPFLASAGMGLF